jgi:deoxyribodipyrimidine photo-lyase
MHTWQVVWFKKDLRTQDHAALQKALLRGPVLCFFAVEPEWLASAEFALRHLDFVVEGLRELQSEMEALGIDFLVLPHSLLEILDAFRLKLGPFELHSHQETGLWWSFERDRKVRRWCRQHGIPWHEYLQQPIWRGMKNRDEWSHFQQQFFRKRPEPLLLPNKLQKHGLGASLESSHLVAGDFGLQTFELRRESSNDAPLRQQVGGRKAAPDFP